MSRSKSKWKDIETVSYIRYSLGIPSLLVMDPVKEHSLSRLFTFIRGAAEEHNKNAPDTIVRKWVLFGLDIKYERRSSKQFWGRFGGGWNWHIGIQAGGSTVLIFALVAMIRIKRHVPTPAIA